MESSKKDRYDLPDHTTENDANAAKFNTEEHNKHVDAIDREENPHVKRKEEEVDPIEYYGF